MKLSYLDLSSSHVSEETMRQLETASDVRLFAGVTVAPYEYGAFVSVPADLSDIDAMEFPDDLKRVLQHARGQGCDIVRLDRDAGVLPDLPRLFDW